MAKMEEKKAKDLSRVLAEINKKAGERVIGRLSTMPNMQIERLKTGVSILDDALGGGFPSKRIIELYGLPSGGKSLICMLTIASAQKEGKSCIYIDVEDSFDPEFATKLGVDVDKLVVAHVGVTEEVMNMIIKLLEAEPDLIVVDSVAAMSTIDEMEEPVEKQFMALKARAMSKALPKLVTLNRKTTLLFINQIRNTMAMYGAKTTTPGGMALTHACSVRLEIKKGDFLRVDGKKTTDVIGQIIKFKITKNKTAPPFKEGAFQFFYENAEIVEPEKKGK